MIRFKILPVFCCFIIEVFVISSYAAEPEAVHHALEKSVSRASKVGIKTQEWQSKRNRMIQEIQELELQDAWIGFQLEKTQRYITAEEKNIAAIEEKLVVAEKTRNSLLPFLEVLYFDLENLVSSDLPFSVQERERRLAFLRSALDDSGMPISDKFSRFLEAIQVESDYGYSVGVVHKVAVDNDDGAAQVSVFRLGRLGLFRIFSGNDRVQRYEKNEHRWQDISKTHVSELKKVIEIAQKKRVTAVVELPVGKFPSDRQEGGRK